MPTLLPKGDLGETDPRRKHEVENLVALSCPFKLAVGTYLSS
jgi:hypothetical protein